VHQLQQLDRELDVTQPARAELELPPGLPRGQRLLHPAAHGLHVLDEVVPAGGLPDQRPEGIRVRLAERHVARRRPGLEQCLELPGLGPALVVGPVAGQRADQRAGPAFRPQVRVDREDAALRGGPRAHPDQTGRQAAGGGQGRGLVLVLDRLGHEDHVDVAGVVELAAAALAHGDHGQTGGRGARGKFGPGHGERRLQDRARDVGQFLAHHVHGRGPGQVARGEVQQAAPVRRGQRGRGLLARGDRAVGVAGVGADRAQQAGPQLGRFRAGDGTAQDLGVLRVPGQVVGQARADAEHRGQPVAEVLLGAERGAQGVLLAGPGRGEQPGQAGQGQVGVGRRGDRGYQRVASQLGRGDAEVVEQQGLGPCGIRESHPRQPPCQRGPRTSHARKLTDPGLRDNTRIRARGP
jgi:hypothetical protein